MSGSILQKELVGINKAGETHTLAELVGKEWLLLDSRWSLQFQTCRDDDGYLLELVGDSRIVSVHPLLLSIFFLKRGRFINMLIKCLRLPLFTHQRED